MSKWMGRWYNLLKRTKGMKSCTLRLLRYCLFGLPLLLEFISNTSKTYSVQYGIQADGGLL